MKIYYQNRCFKLPDFLIVGAARSGTTLLSFLLGKHPQIYFPALKEPMFMALYEQKKRLIDIRTGKKVDYTVERLEDYVQLFKQAHEGQLIGEASTWYLCFYRETLANIAKLYGEKMSQLKIFILLRHPAERAWSHYWHNRREGKEKLNFEEAIEPKVIQERLRKNFVPSFNYIENSRYYFPVKAYLEAMPKTKVFLYEDFVKDIDKTMEDIFSFLQVKPINISKFKDRQINLAGRPKNKISGLLAELIYKPNAFKSLFKGLIPYRWRALGKNKLTASLFQREPMPESLRKKTTAIFRDDVRQLGTILGRDLTRWLEGN